MNADLPAQVGCPVCGSRVAMVSYFRNGADRVRKCRACSAAFVYPRLGGEQLLSQYSPSYFQEKYEALRQSGYVSEDSFQKKVGLCLERVGKLRAGPPGLLLDMGCGQGRFLEAAQQRGWQVQGLELCPQVARQTAERLRVQVYSGSLFEVSLPAESFDLVTMFDVIEHLEQPPQALRICHRILKPGGVLAIGTPNLRGIGVRLLGARAFGVWPDEHIVYFGPAAMRRALGSARFAGSKIISREIYPENASAMISRVTGRSKHRAEVGEKVRPLKQLFRHNPLFKALRSTLNGFFTAVPLGDELLAFTVKP